MSWIRLDSGVSHHPKILELADHLSVSRREARGIVLALWDYCMLSAQDGHLGAMRPRRLARVCDWDGDPDLLTNALVESELLDRACESLDVHGWRHRTGSWQEAQKKAQSRKAVRDNPGQSETILDSPRLSRTPPSIPSSSSSSSSDSEGEEKPRRARKPKPKPPEPDPAPPSKYSLTLREGVTPVPQALLDELRAEWPALDPQLQLEKAELHLLTAPGTKVWTRRGMRMALRTWWRQADTWRREREAQQAAKRPKELVPRYHVTAPDGTRVPLDPGQSTADALRAAGYSA